MAFVKDYIYKHYNLKKINNNIELYTYCSFDCIRKQVTYRIDSIVYFIQ